MEREKYLARRLAEGREAGRPLNHFLAAQRAAIGWAIAELSHLHPEPAARARRDLERWEGNRAVARGGGAP